MVQVTRLVSAKRQVEDCVLPGIRQRCCDDCCTRLGSMISRVAVHYCDAFLHQKSRCCDQCTASLRLAHDRPHCKWTLDANLNFSCAEKNIITRLCDENTTIRLRSSTVAINYIRKHKPDLGEGNQLSCFDHRLSLHLKCHNFVQAIIPTHMPNIYTHAKANPSSSPSRPRIASVRWAMQGSSQVQVPLSCCLVFGIMLHTTSLRFKLH